MANGAPGHFGIEVQNFLNKDYHEWTGRHGTINGSCDLMPWDFCIQGIVENLVFC